MAKISFTCCGKVIEADVLEGDYIRCPKCKRRLRRLFDAKKDTYIFIPENKKRKKK